MRERRWRAADVITWLRILPFPVTWMYAWLGDGRKLR
jgi:hypothetical protein